MTSVAEVGGGGEIINAGGGTVAEREKEFPAAVFGRISAETFVALIAIGISPVCCKPVNRGFPYKNKRATPLLDGSPCVAGLIFRARHLRLSQAITEEAVMANWNWCRGPGCKNTLVEMPFAHCSLACERAEERDLEARKRPGPKAQSTLSMMQAHQIMADETASNYAQTCARNQAVRDARNQDAI
jgi:hypothetical protein